VTSDLSRQHRAPALNARRTNHSESHRQNKNSHIRKFLDDFSCCVDSVQARQIEIKDHNIWIQFSGCLNRTSSVADFRDDVPS